MCCVNSLGKSITLRDVHSLVQRLKARRRGIGTVEDRLEVVLRSFAISAVTLPLCSSIWRPR
ncbi:hypothetical protein JG688_00009271 [Phytophthora aleatoria]|uniref:Uncharacterized protein n=1 Tax=Phytophthora aleatoria TaxID=2496075 RepID=A0A8J5M6S3_9STRA|nr:hypothetical protein JG688_00009271 [Phytophthora aleatoria]